MVDVSEYTMMVFNATKLASSPPLAPCCLCKRDDWSIALLSKTNRTYCRYCLEHGAPAPDGGQP